MSGIVISGDTRGGVGPTAGGRVQPGAYKQAVGAVLARLQQAWNKADAGAVGALFGPEADYVNMAGAHITGADKIAAAHAKLFGEQRSQTAYRILKLKPLSPELVMAFLGQRITVKQGGKDLTVTTRPAMVLRRVGTDWKIVAFQVTRLAGAATGGGASGAQAQAQPAAAKAAPAKAKAAAKPAAKAAAKAAPAKKAAKK
jgi:uncharacterized protein (TIGR02246 family)